MAAGINTFTDLQAAVADEMKRRDMAARIPEFIRTAEREIAEWVDGALPPLGATTATNAVLAAFPMAYLYGATFRGMMFTRDYEAAEAYRTLFQAELTSLGYSPLALPCGLHGAHTCSTP